MLLSMNITQSQFEKTLYTLLSFPGSEAGVAEDAIYNGLLIKGSKRIQRVGFAVSANMRVFELAVKKGCQALVVHHGIKFSDPDATDRLNDRRIEYLFQNNLNLFSAHFLLDAHPTLGNNAQILKFVGARDITPFAFADEQPWGMIGTLHSPTSLASLVKRTQKRFSERTLIYGNPKKPITRIASVSGMGAPSASQCDELRNLGVDLFITGEVNEHHRDIFLESDIACIAGGHYKTETFGIQTLQSVCTKKGWDTVWLSYPNPV